MKLKLYNSVILVVAIIIVLNLLANEYHVRLDLTEDRQYTLSHATRDILRNLEEPITVKAYFTANVPPEIARTRQDFQDMLVEYANLSDGMLVYEFIDPSESEIVEQEIAQRGVQPKMLQVREKDQFKQQVAYLGAIVSMGDKDEAIPAIEPQSPMEYELSTAIKKIAIETKPVLGFIQGHGEAPLDEMIQLKAQLEVLYDMQPVTLTDSTTISENIHTLAIIRPMDSIPPSQLQQLDAFMARGGSLLLAMNRVNGDLQSGFGSPVSTGLESWLEQKGMNVHGDFVIDAQSGAISVPRQIGFFTVQETVPFHYIPVISNFAKHSITSGLEAVMLEFASTVSYSGDSTWKYTPLAFTTELSDSKPAPVQFDIQKEWTENDFTQQHLPVAAALEGKNGNKMVVITDGDFVVNGSPQQPRQLIPDNVNMVANAIDWLSDGSGLIDLRTKGAISRPIRKLESSSRTTIKYVNFLLPILLAVAYGVFRFQSSRIRRMKRMNENYEKA